MVAKNEAATVSIWLCMHLLYRIVLHCIIPRLQLPGECDDSDCLALSDVAYTCKLYFYVFTTVHDDQSAVAFASSFLGSRGTLSCCVIGLQLGHIRLNWSRQIRLFESRSPNPWPGQLHKSYKSMDRDTGTRSLIESVTVAGTSLTWRDIVCSRTYIGLFELTMSLFWV